MGTEDAGWQPKIDRELVIKTAMELAEIYSPTGKEAPVAEYLYEKFQQMGLKAKLQRVADDRYNALGLLEGTGAGPLLMFNGHMDVSHTGKEEDLPGGRFTYGRATTVAGGHEAKKSYKIDEHWFFAPQVANMKSGLAAYVGAVDAILRGGLELKGDILIAAVCGEIEKSSVDDFQGQMYEGYGTGTKYLLAHGGVADICILGETTGLKLCAGHVGTIWVKLTTRDDVLTHTSWSYRAKNPIFKMMKVIGALREWIPDYQSRHLYMGVKPQINISAIQGGWPWRVTRTALYCNLYMDVRIIPDERPTDALAEIKAMMARLKAEDPDVDVDVELLVSAPGTEVSMDEPVVKAVYESHVKLHGSPPEVYTPGWGSDAIYLNQYGIPTVLYGPGGRAWPGEPKDGVFNYQNIDDICNCAHVFALAAVDLCSKSRSQIVRAHE